MRNTLALVEFPEPLAHSGDEIDPFLNVFPSGVVRKFLKALNGNFFRTHAFILTPFERPPQAGER